jgi:hypothetical protein
VSLVGGVRGRSDKLARSSPCKRVESKETQLTKKSSFYDFSAQRVISSLTELFGRAAVLSTVKLTEEVLALHEGIRQVLVLEERAGMFTVTERAGRDEAQRSLDDLHGLANNGALAPAVILGAAAQFAKSPGSMELVAILYNNEGVMLTYLDDSKLLEICTDPPSLYDVMRIVNESLPKLVKEHEIGGKFGAVIKSATEAEEIARGFVMRTSKATTVSINGITHRAADNKWEIQGLYRSSRLSRVKNFRIELDAEDGSVISFLSTSSSRGALYAAELVALVGALFLLSWLLYSSLLRH